ncbi:tetratricopeptide repeat-containing sensor histidine kinase [Aquimarina brevivitae]|uniref:histidine kinase n=1 Tax=Aquimarina brevivitae TaxID=323412 RepID=A0A4Q7NYN2_9FLAO|nr:ATP-binding protein [Aquimarina brevivitae]RZS92556.1 signal transduction histidine kinase [Aquimarina brevivitae]
MKKSLLTISAFFLFFLVAVAKPIAVNQLNFKNIKDTIQFSQAIDSLRILIKANELVKAEKLSLSLIAQGKKMEYHKGLGEAYLYQGRILKKSKKYLKAIRSFDQSEESFKKANDLQGLAYVYNDRFVLEFERGNVERSSDYLLEAKMYYEKLKDSSGLVIVYNNLGNVYAGLQDLDASAEYFKKAIDMRKKTGFTKNIGMVMNNLAYIYLQNNQPKKAKAILPEALAINKKDSIDASIAHSYNIMAEVALYEEDYDLAKKYYETSLDIAKESYEMLAVDNKQQLGYLAMKSGKYKKAERLLAAARKEFTDFGAIQSLLKNYQFTSKLDSARGNLAGALEWQKKYQKLSDKRMADLSSDKMERAEARYKAELEQLKRLDEQEKQEQKTKNELFKYRIYTYSALGVLLIIAVFSIFIIRSRRERKRLIKELHESNLVKNKLFSIISHDLKNEISGLDGTLKLLKENTISVEEFNEIIPLLANRTNQTWIMLNNLLNWSKSQMNELNANPVSFDINDLIASKFEFFKPKADQKDIKLINELKNATIYADKDMVSIVAQNLLANAIKFCNPGDTIALQSIEREDHYDICFKDSGVGIDPSNLHKLFAEDTFTTTGTQNESGTGLGLKICKELVELNNGKIKVESELGKGSTFYISLPKAA